MLEFLLHVDRQLFVWINSGWSNPILDAVLPLWRDRLAWFPAYGLLMSWLCWRFRWRALPFIAALLVAVATSDLLSSHLIKPWVSRPRPCHEPAVLEALRLLVVCGPSPGFTSSHAANHFCVALVLGLGLRHLASWVLSVALLWAASIAVAQVYVGVHYPLDVLVGALVGAAVGWGVSKVYRYAGMGLVPAESFKGQ